MPRRVRLEIPGYYHIINRGVERRKVFLSKVDKDKFLDILCKEFKFYNITLHSYILMDNHYHLLIQNHKENLSSAMRQINSKYAIYFNKKYKRVGHLWQDRYKSWMILSEDYFFTLFRYFELNPIEAKITNSFAKYYRSFLYDLQNNKMLKCAKNSYFLTFDKKYIYNMLDIELSQEDLEKLSLIKNDNRDLKHEKNYKPKPDIQQFFKDIYSKQQRNKAIFKAYKSGLTQKDIADFLKLTPSTISKIIKSYEKLNS